MHWIARLAVVALGVIAAVMLAGYLVLRASLPQLDGQVEVVGLTAPVSVSRDALGVVTIAARTRADAAFATGFVHAQERFFQMDLQRRAGAGELAALLGPALVEADRHLRLHRFRARAERLLARLPAPTRALYEVYADGVNAGLAALDARPFEYFVLRTRPQAWQALDTLLVMYSMWFELNDETAQRESELGLLRDSLPEPVYAWLIQSGTDWDAPLRGGPVPPVPMPTAEQYDLRAMPPEWFADGAARHLDSGPHYGSNNWAVAGSHTASGHAILANDMHLGHDVPNIWFRARLLVASEGLDVSGVMLSGAPLIVAGSNGAVAWGFTNSYGDWEDLVVLETDPDDPTRYRTPDGWREFVVHDEPIAVASGATVDFTVRETTWGPVLDVDHRGRPRALRWLAHEVEATHADLGRFERVRTVDEALAAANRIGAPPQNIVVADANGRIGWTIMGRIPRRVGVDPLHPSSWSDGRGWHGWLAPEDYPRIVDPPSGVLWTANARTVDDDWLALIGEGNHPTGARARQIRDGLLARSYLGVDDMLEIQLDDRAVFLERWQSLLLGLLDDQAVAEHPQRAQVRDLVLEWGARAAIESAGFRFVRGFRNLTIEAVTAAVIAPVRARHEAFELTRHSQLERPVWQAISGQPAHLLDPRYASWNDWLLAIVDELIGYYADQSGGLAARTWGELNTVRIAHPLADSLPGVGAALSMPAEPLPGATDMPRVQGVAFGASQRLALSPGQEQAGYLHMPGGQSGHPLSPFFGAGHAQWAHGEPTPFLPGPAQHELTLIPRSR